MKELDTSKIKGLSGAEVSKQKSLGLINQKIDSFSPSYFTILRRNLLNQMNLVLIPLIILLLIYELYRDFMVFSIFVTVNTLVNAVDEIRIKKRVEGLITEFSQTARVIRDGEIKEIPADEVVLGDTIMVNEGEPILTDGNVIQSKYLQIDESALTGESDYVNKATGDKVLSGSYVVTGTVIYKADAVGKENYFNKLGEKSLTYVRHKSGLEQVGGRFLTFFVVAALLSGVIVTVAANAGGATDQELILSFTTLIAMTIPQTLIFLFTLSFVISITKLAKKGILVQKRGAMDDLAHIDTICIDKTGTITTNQMNVIDAKFTDTSFEKIATFFNSIPEEIFGANKTTAAVLDFFRTDKKININSFSQIPFTSRHKFSAYQGTIDGKTSTYILGAPTKLLPLLKDRVENDIKEYTNEQQSQGHRALLLLETSTVTREQFLKESELISTLINDNLRISSVSAITIQEQLNPGVAEIIKKLGEQNIEIKVISGDGPKSVTRIVNQVGINTDHALDLSKDKIDSSANIFTRATPEDKYTIIKQLQENGKRVAMIGDGVNDVLGLKQATVGISMQEASKVTRDIADIVLLDNDFKKIPDIFYEGNNLVFNLRLTTKIYFTKAWIAFTLVAFFALTRTPIPILPSTTLIFSFLGGTFPAYVVAFSRSNVNRQKEFTKNIFISGVPSGILIGSIIIILYVLYESSMNADKLNTFLALSILATSIIYSFFIIWESGKLRDISLFIVAGLFAFGFGTAQTILPFYGYIDESLPVFFNKDIPLAILLCYISIWASLAVTYGLTRLTGNIKTGIGLGVLTLLLALLYPTRIYYATEPVPIRFFPAILIVTIIAFIGILLIHQIPRRIHSLQHIYK